MSSSKRRATSDLNHDNWDREFEPESKGTFQSAPEDELKTRVIKKARRKLGTSEAIPEENTDGATKSIFSSFPGFNKTQSNATTASISSSFSTNSSETFVDSEKNIFSFLNKFAQTPSEENKKEPSKESISNNETTSTNNNYNFSKSNTYYAKLKGLNQAVSNWIKTHVDKNPLCLLTPIFKDYEKYLAEIEKHEASPPKSDGKQTKAMSDFKFSATPAPTTSTTFSFGIKTTDANVDTTPKSTSIFGNASQNTTEKAKTGFVFGSKSDDSNVQSTSNSATGFSFSGAKPFSFGNIAPPPAANPPADTENGDEEDEPPKVEFKAVVEEDSVYSHRCKVFVKHDGNFADRGVGTLYLKPVKDSDKTQLIVRADTNLGNILVNLILNDSIPTQRMGKNNVMLVCIPTPDTEKPTPMLLRVKTSEDADKLLETIDKYKK